jgi:hypothetical protein
MYLTQSVIADDAYMRLRVASVAAQQGCANDFGIDPDLWTQEWRRVWAASPGWDTAWESAQAAGITEIGAKPDVITDPMILSQVQVMMPFDHVSDHRPEVTPEEEWIKDYVDQRHETALAEIGRVEAKVDGYHPLPAENPEA